MIENLEQIYAELEAADKSYIPDKWQKQVLEHDGNIALRTGRQAGKSETIGKKCARLSVRFKGITILMVAAAQRQSSEIFQKTLKNLWRLHEKLLELEGGFHVNTKWSARQNDDARREFEERHGLFESLPTKTEARLKNGTRILSLPTGKTGAYVRCYSVDILIGDEAAYIPEPVWLAIRPMLATSKQLHGLGWEILLSTPFGKGGHYYEACFDPDYLQIHVSSEDCPRITKDFLAKEKRKLSKLEYSQEYLGEFVDEFNQLFPTELIKRRMSFIGWEHKTDYSAARSYYLGVDIARYGEDENGFVIAEMESSRKIKIVAVETSERKSITETIGRIMYLDGLYHFRRIFIDSAGVGGGALDLLIEKLGHRRVVGLENARKTIKDEETDRKKGILKEDMYSNAMVLMEAESPAKIEIISDLRLLHSLKSMTFEYTADKNLKIYGKDSHLAEAFVRACWSIRDRGLNLFIC
jgi:hypothetical protein